MDKSLNLCVQQLSEFDHREFLVSIKFTDSIEDNLKTLIQVTNYFKRVMLMLNLASQTITAKSLQVTGKYNYYKERLATVEFMMNELADKSYSIKEKFVAAKKTHINLLDRTEHVVRCIRDQPTELNEAEKQFKFDLQGLHSRVTFLKTDIHHIKLKRTAIETYQDKLEKQKGINTGYLEDWQVNLVKENMKATEYHIRNILNELLKIKIPKITGS